MARTDLRHAPRAGAGLLRSGRDRHPGGSRSDRPSSTSRARSPALLITGPLVGVAHRPGHRRHRSLRVGGPARTGHRDRRSGRSSSGRISPRRTRQPSCRSALWSSATPLGPAILCGAWAASRLSGSWHYRSPSWPSSSFRSPRPSGRRSCHRRTLVPVVLATVCTAIAFLLFGALIDSVGPVRRP